MPYILQVAIGRRSHLNVFGDNYNTSDGTGKTQILALAPFSLVLDQGSYSVLYCLGNTPVVPSILQAKWDTYFFLFLGGNYVPPVVSFSLLKDVGQT